MILPQQYYHVAMTSLDVGKRPQLNDWSKILAVTFTTPAYMYLKVRRVEAPIKRSPLLYNPPGRIRQLAVRLDVGLEILRFQMPANFQLSQLLILRQFHEPTFYSCAFSNPYITPH